MGYFSNGAGSTLNMTWADHLEDCRLDRRDRDADDGSWRRPRAAQVPAPKRDIYVIPRGWYRVTVCRDIYGEGQANSFYGTWLSAEQIEATRAEPNVIEVKVHGPNEYQEICYAPDHEMFGTEQH